MLESLVDEAIARFETHQLNCHPGGIPDDMLTGKSEDDELYWKAIPSTASNQDLRELEERLGVVFSPLYRTLLQYKHFIELQIGEVSFFEHPSDRWKEVILKNVFAGWPKELLVEKGYLPFANYSDWGLWCFAMNKADENGEFSVHQWDHERPTEFEFVADDLVSALQIELAKQGA